MRADTIRALMWWDWYGFLRQEGFTPLKACLFLNSSAEQLSDPYLAGMKELTDRYASDSLTAAQKDQAAATTGVGIATTVLGTAAAACQLIPGPGTIVGAVLGAVAAVMSALTQIFNVDCDRYDMTGSRSYHRRGVVGISPPPGAIAYDSTSSCGCVYVHRRCGFIQMIHDGAVMAGFGASGSPDKMGRTIGVSSYRHGERGQKCYIRGRDDRGKTPDIVAGAARDRAYWTLPASTWWFRSWRVHAFLQWCQDKLSDKHLACMEKALLSAPQTASESSKFQEGRRRGSRWYASFVAMGQDLFELRARAGNPIPRAAAPSKGAPWYWWNAVKDVRRYKGFNDLREALTEAAIADADAEIAALARQTDQILAQRIAARSPKAILARVTKGQWLMLGGAAALAAVLVAAGAAASDED